MGPCSNLIEVPLHTAGLEAFMDSLFCFLKFLVPLLFFFKASKVVPGSGTYNADVLDSGPFSAWMILCVPPQVATPRLDLMKQSNWGVFCLVDR